ncbi:hypothetical protein LCL61_23850 [Amycolatopsis coloradensis]|uniref:Uncharacterized protein n=1 Tax=Amycolatopsis coloradensis TaxID=76021 RepID=A0ACD5BGQ5_9PSEU
MGFPGLGRSGGELTPETATVPALADWAARCASALKISGPIAVAGHDIGGAVAQHLLASGRLEVSRPALVNSVLYVSWPAPPPSSGSLTIRIHHRQQLVLYTGLW